MNRKVFFTVDKALGALLLEEDSEFVEAIGLDSASELLARSESPDVEDVDVDVEVDFTAAA